MVLGLEPRSLQIAKGIGITLPNIQRASNPKMFRAVPENPLSAASFVANPFTTSTKYKPKQVF